MVLSEREVAPQTTYIKAHWLAEHLPRVLAAEPTIMFADGSRVMIRGISRRSICVMHAFGVRPAGTEQGLVIAHQWHDVRRRGPLSPAARCGAAIYRYDPGQPEDTTAAYCDDRTSDLFSTEATVHRALGAFTTHLRSMAIDPTRDGRTQRGLATLQEGPHRFTDELIVAGIGQLGILSQDITSAA